MPEGVSDNAFGLLRICRYSSLRLHLQIILVSHLSGAAKSMTQGCAGADSFPLARADRTHLFPTPHSVA